jgi:zinc transport system substrate-binding protein
MNRPPDRTQPLRGTAFALGVAALAACAGCGREPESPAAAPRVVATIFPLGDLAAMVAGNDLRVDVLVPPRADPATFEPSARQIRAAAGARAYLMVGGGMDDWAQSVPDALASVPETRMNEGIALRAGGEGEGTGDPHTWLDPILVRDLWLPKIEAALVAVRPDARERLAARARAVADSLTALDAWLADRLAPARGHAFIATHAAWAYFGERYGVRELGAVHESPGREPSARRLAALVDSARAAGVRAVFTEPQLGETGARSLAAELGVPVHVLDPLGGPGLAGRDGYLALMRFNADQIARALAAEP